MNWSISNSSIYPPGLVFYLSGLRLLIRKRKPTFLKNVVCPLICQLIRPSDSPFYWFARTHMKTPKQYCYYGSCWFLRKEKKNSLTSLLAYLYLHVLLHYLLSDRWLAYLPRLLYLWLILCHWLWFWKQRRMNVGLGCSKPMGV